MSAYLEVLRIPYTSSKGLFIANILNYTQKAVTCYRSPLLQIYLLHTKKAGLHCCCSASQGSRIAYHSEQATPKPTPICTHAHTLALFRCTDIDIHIPRTSKCCNVLDTYEFTRFVKPSTKRVMTPLLCLQSRGAAVQYCSILFNIVQSCSILTILFFHSKFAVQRYNKICNCANFLVESLEFKV